ncbi:MAG: DUF4143 domain-containing protein [Candidatus Methanoplasma sp.]|jgi:predicted AAA+ superfamily ATPase|nr:DUF4143 domain-containing protein [Candidatus Methanoplasma sp.]
MAREPRESRDRAQRIASQYVKAIVNSDFSRFDGVKRSPVLIGRIVESISRNVSTSASREAVRRDVNGSGGAMAESTLADYIDAMETIFLIENLPPGTPTCVPERG